MTYFPAIEKITFKGDNAQDLLCYRHYNPEQMVLGKTMAEHLRIAVCMWHNFVWQGHDIFGENAFIRPWLQAADPMEQAKQRLHAAFEFIEKLNVPFFTFHDRDVAPEGSTLKESNQNLQMITEELQRLMEKTNIKLLWGTANLFSNRRYLAGSATNPDPEIFAYACAQVKQAIDITHQLNGENYVLWGGREGYDTLLNTDLKQEAKQYAKFLTLIAEYKHKIGFKGTLLIEPKPCEPTAHQYDFDTATVFAFLQKYGLEKEYKVNIERNHATLSGHSFPHEVAYAFANNLFGSVDANQGDPKLGWDTDQYPARLAEVTEVIYLILQNGGFTTGGFNFDTKLRRQSISLDDLFYAHIHGIDTLARALLSAAKLIEQGKIEAFKHERYGNWQQSFGQEILTRKLDLETISQHVLENNLEPEPKSGRQEMLESLVNYAL